MLLEPTNPVVHRAEVSRDFFDIGDGSCQRAGALEQEEVGQGRLGTLDLARKDRFLAHVHVEEEVGIRQIATPTVQATEGKVSLCLRLAELWTELGFASDAVTGRRGRRRGRGSTALP